MIADGDQARHAPAAGQGGYAAGYSDVARVLHWVTAALMLTVVVLGLAAHNIADGALRTTLLESYHKPLGLTVLLITVVRLAHRFSNPMPLGDLHLLRWEIAAARAGHALLYALLFLLPLSGLLMSQGAGRNTSFFGLFTVPQVLMVDPLLPPRQQYWYKVGKFLHTSVFDWALYAAFLFHLVGVMKHSLIDRDPLFLGRMWGRRRGVR